MITLGLSLFILANGGAQEHRRLVNITADRVDYSFKEGQEVATFSGHAVATQGTTAIRADEMKIFSAQEKAICQGHVLVEDKTKGIVLRGDHLEYHSVPRYGLITKDAKLTRTGEDDLLITITSEQMEFFLREDKVRAQGCVEICWGDTTSRSDLATYLVRDQKVILEGHVRAVFYPGGSN